jgi:N-acetylglucosamine kinase-like BadF-type ATPase
MSYVLGIDGGGSKTVCVLMDDTLQVLGRGVGGSSNYQSVGVEAALQSIHAAIYAAVNEGLKLINSITVTALCLGLAGVGRSTDVEFVKGMVRELQNSTFLPIIWDLQPSTIFICHDALIALAGGLGHSVGIVVASGTGSIVFGCNHQGETKRVGGWGYILGDEGSAYKIAVAGMQAALKAYDGRGSSTNLLEVFQQHFSLASIEDLIEVIYRRGWGVKEIAALAPIVDVAAVSGDEVANRIIDDAVVELVTATATVIKAIFSDDSNIEIVTTGSVWQGTSNIHNRFTSVVSGQFQMVKVIFPRYEPAYGAGLLALHKLVETV